MDTTPPTARFFVPIEPQAQPRARNGRYPESAGRTVAAYRERVLTAFLARRKGIGWPIEGPSVVRLESIIHHPRTQPREGWAHLDPRDVDNLSKNVLDALEGAAFTNDRRVCLLSTAKVEVGHDEPEGVFLYIRGLTAEDLRFVSTAEERRELL